MTAEPANITIELDARDLEPPEPMQQALAALAVLKPGEQLRMLLHREPFPLYAILRERGFTYRTTQQADGSYEILIRL
jgi:TusA-related sulfurtransferase